VSDAKVPDFDDVIDELRQSGGPPPVAVVTAEDWRKLLVGFGWPEDTKVRIENGRVMVTRPERAKPFFIIQREPKK